MPLLQVRNVPDELYEKLKVTAANDKRSITQETIVLLENALEEKSDNMTRRRFLLNKIDKMKNHLQYDTVADPADLIREDRDR